jgi:hypothetical protein
VGGLIRDYFLLNRRKITKDVLDLFACFLVLELAVFLEAILTIKTHVSVFSQLAFASTLAAKGLLGVTGVVVAVHALVALLVIRKLARDAQMSLNTYLSSPQYATHGRLRLRQERGISLWRNEPN